MLQNHQTEKPTRNFTCMCKNHKSIAYKQEKKISFFRKK